MTEFNTMSMHQFRRLLELSDSIVDYESEETITYQTYDPLDSVLKISIIKPDDFDSDYVYFEEYHYHQIYHHFRYKIIPREGKYSTHVLCLVENDENDKLYVYRLFGYDVVAKAKQGFTKTPQTIYREFDK